MFKTRKIDCGTVKCTHESSVGDIGVEIIVDSGVVSHVKLDLEKMKVEVIGGDDIYMYNKLVATIIPDLIEKGML